MDVGQNARIVKVSSYATRGWMLDFRQFLRRKTAVRNAFILRHDLQAQL